MGVEDIGISQEQMSRVAPEAELMQQRGRP